MFSKPKLSSALVIFLMAGAGGLMAADKKKPAAETAKTSPKLTIVEPVRDFGVIPKGEKINWSFEIKNTGTSDLEILSAQPGCGCTVADFDKVIKPGKTGKVSTVVDTVTFSGPIQKSVTIQTNDPDNPTAQLSVNAVVKPYVEALPKGFVRFPSLFVGDTQSDSLTLYTEDEEPFEIIKIEVPGDHIKVTKEKITDEKLKVKAGKAGQNQYKLTFAVGGPTAKVGMLADKVKIHTNSKHQPEYVVSVSGLIRPSVKVEPTVLNFGEVGVSDATAERSVRVASLNKATADAFKVTKVESSSPKAFTAEAKPTGQPGEYQLVVKVGKNMKPGDFDGTIKIHSNDKFMPVYTLPVRGSVKAATAASAAATK